MLAAEVGCSGSTGKILIRFLWIVVNRQQNFATDGDFRDMPFADESFRLVVFDPPHLIRAGEKSWLEQKYGKLNRNTWKDDLRKGFSECFRVLELGGFLIFKWNEIQVRINEVVKLAPVQPLFGQRGRKTHWLVFMKGEIK